MHRLSVFSVLLIVACAPAAQTTTGGSGATAQAGATARAGMAAPGAGFMGNYTVTLAESDIPATAPQELRTGTVGTWRIAFHPGNHLMVSYNGKDVVQGPYEIRGNQVTFGAGDTGPYACKTAATYTWQVSNGQMTFTPVGTDTCQGRVLALTTRALSREP